MRKIIAKFSSRCAETGARIYKGEACLYDPINKKVYHFSSQMFKDFEEEATSAPTDGRDPCAGYIEEALEAGYYHNFH